jgi:mannose/cellobiose epimerase-like protein (N-acyl-D-glucosamine 2-epimerase family)
MQTDQLRELADRFNAWLRGSALPLWWEKGADRSEGGYHELLDLDGTPPPSDRRARVQSRQSYVYCVAGSMGWDGPWREAAQHGIDYLIRRYRRDDGQFCTLVSAHGDMRDAAVKLYDQAFALLAMASVVKVLPQRGDLRDRAHALLACIEQTRAHAAGGFVETGAKRFLSNPHMHLLEAMLAWGEVEPGTVWDKTADHIAELCRRRFIDAEGGFLREVFDEAWNPAAGADGHVVEPGHQFEWAWLLSRWGKLRSRPEVLVEARRLFEHGCRGVDAARDAAVHAMDDSFAVTVPTARLWAQTERLKAALILAGPQDERLLGEAIKAAKTLWRFLETTIPGLWRDRFEPDGSFAVEPAPASSFYHIVCCIEALNGALGRHRPL